MWIFLWVLVCIIGAILYIGHRAHRADWGSWPVNCLDGLSRLICQHYHRLAPTTVPLPETGPAIIAANHVSGLDPMILCAISDRPVRYMIAREPYERVGFQWLFKAVGCIPVDRKGRPEKALRDALRALQKGEVLGIFPHGKIQHEGQPVSKLKGGTVRLASWSNAAIYPVRISGIKGGGKVMLAPFIRSHVTVEHIAPINCNAESMTESLAQIEQFINGPE